MTDPVKQILERIEALEKKLMPQLQLLQLQATKAAADISQLIDAIALAGEAVARASGAENLLLSDFLAKKIRELSAEKKGTAAQALGQFAAALNRNP